MAQGDRFALFGAPRGRRAGSRDDPRGKPPDSGLYCGPHPARDETKWGSSPHRPDAAAGGEITMDGDRDQVGPSAGTAALLWTRDRRSTADEGLRRGYHRIRLPLESKRLRSDLSRHRSAESRDEPKQDEQRPGPEPAASRDQDLDSFASWSCARYLM